MNYIKQLQADKAEALDSARSIEAAIKHPSHFLSVLPQVSRRYEGTGRRRATRLTTHL